MNDDSDELPLNPQPFTTASTGVVLTSDNIETYKRLDCIHYDPCLTKVAHRKWNKAWENFHCNDCLAYKPKPPEALLLEFKRLEVLSYEIIEH